MAASNLFPVPTLTGLPSSTLPLRQLLRPSADRRKDQRTRTTAVAIGTQRLEAVRQYLIDLCGAPYADRIELRRARLRMVPTEDPQQTPLGRVIATPKRRRL